MCARFLVFKPASAMKVNAWTCAPGTDRDLESGLSKEHKCQDPKDGERCLTRARSGETLVEVPSDTDVQIVRYPWVSERITHQTIQ